MDIDNDNKHNSGDSGEDSGSEKPPSPPPTIMKLTQPPLLLTISKERRPEDKERDR